MRKSRFAEAQIVGILQEVAAGAGVQEDRRSHRIAEKTYLRWKQHYGGQQVAGAKKIKALEDENRWLKSWSPICCSTTRGSETLWAKSGDPEGAARGRYRRPSRPPREPVPRLRRYRLRPEFAALPECPAAAP